MKAILLKLSVTLLQDILQDSIAYEGGDCGFVMSVFSPNAI